MLSKNLKFVFLGILALVWGSSFILIKKGLLSLNPAQLGALRMVIAAIFILIIGFRSLFQIRIHQWKYLALTGLLGTFIPVFLFSTAQTQISSAVSSIMNSLTPLHTLVFGIWFFKIDFQRRQIFGVIIGLLGSALLIISGAMDDPNTNYYYALLLIVASWCYAMNVNLVKIHLADLSPMSITAGNFAVLLLPALAVLFFSGYFDVAHESEVQTASLYVLLLGIVGTALANIIFFKLIKISSPVFASSVTYLIPLVAFSWGLLDNEYLTFIQVIGAFVILLGVYLSARR